MVVLISIYIFSLLSIILCWLYDIFKMKASFTLLECCIISLLAVIPLLNTLMLLKEILIYVISKIDWDKTIINK